MVITPRLSELLARLRADLMPYSLVRLAQAMKRSTDLRFMHTTRDVELYDSSSATILLLV